MRSGLITLLCMLIAANTTLGLGFKILDAEIDAAPNQQIVVTGIGTDAVQGMNLYVQARNAPLAITGFLITGTIWEPNNTGPSIFVYPTPGLDNAQLGLMSVTTESGTVDVPGTVGIVVVDATGLGGQTAVLTADTDFAPSDYASLAANEFIDGTITIRSTDPPANAAPTIDAGTDQSVTAGDPVTLSGTATDDDGDTMTYAWVQVAGPPVALGGDDGLSPTFTAPTVTGPTALTFQLTVSDGTDASIDTVTVTVQPAGPPPANQPPAIDAGQNQAVISGATVELSGTASDPESDPMVYEWAQTAGPAVTITGAATLTPLFTAPTVQTQQNVIIELAVSDGTSTSTDTVTITVSPVAVNASPQINAGTDRSVTAGDSVTLSGTASDPEGDALTYTWSRIAGPTVNLSSSHTLAPSFVAPVISQTTTLTFQLVVSDGINTATDTVNVTVQPSDSSGQNAPPLVDAGTNRSVESGSFVSLTGTAFDPEGATMTYAWTRTGTPPVALSGADTLTVSFTAPTVTQSTPLVFQLSASDGVNTTADAVTVTVLPAGTSSADAGEDGADGGDTSTDSTGDNTTGPTGDDDAVADNTGDNTGDTSAGNTNGSSSLTGSEAVTSIAPNCAAGASQSMLTLLAGIGLLRFTGRRGIHQ